MITDIWVRLHMAVKQCWVLTLCWVSSVLLQLLLFLVFAAFLLFLFLLIVVHARVLFLFFNVLVFYYVLQVYGIPVVVYFVSLALIRYAIAHIHMFFVFYVLV